jgi:hypothetical protein
LGRRAEKLTCTPDQRHRHVVGAIAGRACGADRQRLVSEFLKVLHPIFGEQIQRVPRLLIKLDALAMFGTVKRLASQPRSVSLA